MNQSANFPCIKRYREGLRELLERPADFLITANYNQPGLSLLRARKKLQHLHACMDRATLGKRWQTKPCGERIFFIAVPEIANGKLHHHMVLRVPKWVDKAHFRAEIPKLFAKKIAASGSLDIQALTGKHGSRRVAEYLTKANLIGEFVISTEFMGK